MNADKVLHQLAEQNNFKLKGFSSLTGGDINEVFLLNTSTEKLVVKLNDAAKFPGMFDAEKTGLKILAKPDVIDVPKVFAIGIIENTAYILLEFIEAGPKSPNFPSVFGKQLAALHQTTTDKFGFSEDNYIGRLSQQNHAEDSASEFYINQRLQPQLKLAREKGYELEIKDSFFKNISDLIPKEPPALIHGDLWNGNYLVNSKGLPCLIDPATAFAPREMDLAMMKLFGGFDAEIFKTYEEAFPLTPEFEERIPLWQLYYLLVHLNLFGLGYRNAVSNILKSFS